jgi:hypothetical protein
MYALERPSDDFAITLLEAGARAGVRDKVRPAALNVHFFVNGTWLKLLIHMLCSVAFRQDGQL